MTYPGNQDNPQWSWKDRDGLLIANPSFMIDPFVITLTSRRGGASAPPYQGLNLGLSTGDDEAIVRANRDRLMKLLGIEGRAVVANQVHGIRVVEVENPGTAPDCDALVTRKPDLYLVISTADCYAILLGEPFAGITAALHAGWRGLSGCVIERTLDAITALGGDTGQVRAWVGPGIGRCCYAVGEEVASRFDPDLSRGEEGVIRLDLREAVHRALERQGLWPRNIVMSSFCTSCRTDLFYSHRAENGRTGRSWSLIGRPSKTPEPIYEITPPSPDA